MDWTSASIVMVLLSWVTSVPGMASPSTMTLTSALVPPLVNIAVRDHLAARFGWEQVGYWQAVSRVADAYSSSFAGSDSWHTGEELRRIHAPAKLVQAWESWTRFLDNLPESAGHGPSVPVRSANLRTFATLSARTRGLSIRPDASGTCPGK